MIAHRVVMPARALQLTPAQVALLLCLGAPPIWNLVWLHAARVGGGIYINTRPLSELELSHGSHFFLV